MMSSCLRRMTLFSMHASKQSSLARSPMETSRSATNCRPKTTSLYDSGSVASPSVGLFKVCCESETTMHTFASPKDRLPALQAGGHRFDPGHVHQFLPDCKRLRKITSARRLRYSRTGV